MTSQTSPSVTRALVLFSGGQDSATCLAWALDRFDLVETIGFDYGQRHAVELTCREKVRIGMASLKEAWATRLGDDHMIDATVLKSLGVGSESNLIDKNLKGKMNSMQRGIWKITNFIWEALSEK